MLDPIELLTGTIIPVLRSMPTLLATVGDEPENIYAYVHSYPTSVGSLFSALPQQRTPSILVAHRSTAVGGGRGNGIEHNYSCFLRAEGNIGPMFVALRDGVPSGIGRKFKLTQIHSGCHPPRITSLSLQSMLISEQQFIEYYEAPLVLAEHGLDS
jgi:hypothetical protein